MVELSDQATIPAPPPQPFLTPLLPPCSYPCSTHTVLIFVNSRIPQAPNSRPWPDHFTPPNGIRGSEATIRLMNTIPASSSLMNFRCSAASLVQALAPSPNRLSFAIRIASLMSFARNPLEHLFLVSGRILEDVHQHRRCIKIPRPVQRLPAGQNLRPCFHGLAHVAIQVGHAVRRGKGSHFRALVKWVSHFQRGHFLREQLLKLLRDALRHDKTLRRDA